MLSLETVRAALPDTEATASGQIDLDGNVRISVAMSSDDLRMVDQFFTQVRRYRGERPAPRPLELRGGGRVEGNISGPLEQLAFDGTLSARTADRCRRADRHDGGRRPPFGVAARD